MLYNTLQPNETVESHILCIYQLATDTDRSVQKSKSLVLFGAHCNT